MDGKLESRFREQPASTQLQELAGYRMPFGKYAGRLLIDLPEPYVVWFSQKGYPAGRLGLLLQLVYEIKVNGLEYLFEPLRKAEGVQVAPKRKG